MRQAISADAPIVHQTYSEALEHAYDVGFIDWPCPFPKSLAIELVDSNSLYCFDSNKSICGAAKISSNRNEQVWSSKDDALYLSKVATADSVRGTGFFRTVMLPEIQEFNTNELPLRLDCLAYNVKLRRFYESVGFICLEAHTFFSRYQQKSITVAKYELS